MQCNDCQRVYLADDKMDKGPNCGGQGTILIDVTREFFGSRKEARAAGYIHGKKLEKYVPCPACKGKSKSWEK